MSGMHVVSATYIALFVTGPALAQAAPETPAEPPAEHAFDLEARRTLEDAGVVLGLTSTAELTSVLSGGIRSRTSFREITTLSAEATFRELFPERPAFSGASVFFEAVSVEADDGGSLDAGDTQGLSNIQIARHLDAISQVWYQHQTLDDRLRIKIGKFDANADFASTDIAGDFANSSAGFSPTIVGFPSYPNPAFGVAAFADILDGENAGLTIGYALFDGATASDGIRTGSRGPASALTDDASNDWFHIAQLDGAWNGSERAFGRGRASLGVWQHTGSFTRFEGGTSESTLGFYATVETAVLSPESGPSVHVFAQLGAADESVSGVAVHAATGAVLGGMVPSRSDDSIGVYLTRAEHSSAPGSGFTDDETTLDVYYRLALTPWAYVQPEMQFIKNPGGAGTDDAIVAGLRVGVSF